MARDSKSHDVSSGSHDVSSGSHDASNGVDRRAFLAAAGGAGIAGLAGCTGDGGGDGGGGDGGGDGSGDGDGGGDGGDGGGDGGGGDSGGGMGTVTYGVVSPMSGAYSSLAPAQRKGAELAAETISQSDEFSFEMAVATGDTETDPTAGRQAAQRVIEQDGATYLMGAISSSVALSLNELAADEGVIYNPGGAAVPITGESCNEWVFRAETNTAQIAEAVSAYTVNNLGTNVWFHIADYAYGESVLNRTQRRMKEANSDFTNVGESRSQLGADNYDSFISDIANSDADVAVLGMTGGDLITFVGQAADQGLKEEVELVSPTMTFQVVRGALGPAAYGTYGGVRYVPSLETGGNPEFVEAYQEAYDEVPDNFARVGYQSLVMTARGIEEAGTTDPAAVKDVLSDLEMDSIFGTNQFRACDGQALNPTWMAENVEGDGEMAEVDLLEEVAGEDAALPCDETGCDAR
jgi:branched-chain amino acid transport system substrate-binding protein